MSDKIIGKAGNYKVSETRQSVRMMVRMPRAMFRDFMTLCKRHHYDDAGMRNSLVCAWIWGELNAQRTPAQIERDRKAEKAFAKRTEKMFGKQPAAA